MCIHEKDRPPGGCTGRRMVLRFSRSRPANLESLAAQGATTASAARRSVPGALSGGREAQSRGSESGYARSSPLELPAGVLEHSIMLDSPMTDARRTGLIRLSSRIPTPKSDPRSSSLVHAMALPSMPARTSRRDRAAGIACGRVGVGPRRRLGPLRRTNRQGWPIRDLLGQSRLGGVYRSG
jgi:hypothetical protein